MKNSNAKTRSIQIEELQNIVQTADCNYKIWWIYSNREDREVYLATMNEARLFFRAAIHAHFLATIVALYALYETRRDTINISQLMRGIPKDIEVDSRAKLLEAKVLWKKIGILRNECFGHVSSSLSTDQVFKKAGLRPDDLARLIELSKDIANAISYAHDRSSHIFNLDPAHEVRNLLDQLKGLNTANC